MARLQDCEMPGQFFFSFLTPSLPSLESDVNEFWFLAEFLEKFGRLLDERQNSLILHRREQGHLVLNLALQQRQQQQQHM